MRTSWEKLVQYVETSYGHDISKELQNKIAVVLPEPEYELAILTRHGARETMVRDGHANLRAARELQRGSLQTMMDAGSAPADTPFKLAVVENEIAQGDFDVNPHGRNWSNMREPVMAMISPTSYRTR